MAATKVSVHIREIALGEEFVLEHVEGGAVQVYDIDYPGGVSGTGRNYRVMFAVVEPISDKEATTWRENPPAPGAVGERYKTGESSAGA